MDIQTLGVIRSLDTHHGGHLVINLPIMITLATRQNNKFRYGVCHYAAPIVSHTQP